MKDLEYLNLYATMVSDEGLKHLTGLSNLKRVYVWQSKVTDAGMKSLEKQIPGLKVIGESKIPVIPISEEELKKREEAVKKKEQELKAKEDLLNKREAAIHEKEKENGK